MTDGSGGSAKPRVTLLDYAVYAIGVAGLSWAITSVWLGMRAVMALGGTCASGGPYEIGVECPDSVSVIMFLAFPIGFVSAGLIVWRGIDMGGPWAGLVGLAWPAIFLSLGFNFLQFAFAPPDGGHQVVWGWLIPGVLFVLMGGFPVIGWLKFRDHTTILPGIGPRPTPKNYAELGRALREAAQIRASGQRVPPTAVTSARVETAGAPQNLVEGLERLARLHADGSLNNVEYEQAKRALIDSAARGQLGGQA